MKSRISILLVLTTILSACNSELNVVIADLLPQEMVFTGIPKYYEEDQYIEKKIAKIPKNQSSFFFITDTHLFLDNSTTKRNARNSSSLMYYIKQQTGINVGIFGGDCFDYNSTRELAASNLSDYSHEFFSVFGKKGLWVQGNHDNNSNAISSLGISEDDALITDEDAYNRTVRYIEDVVVFDEIGLNVLKSSAGYYGVTPIYPKAKDWFKMHYYKDDPYGKTRFIILESGDNSWSAKRFSSHYGVLWMQMDFVASALQSIPQNYNAVIAFHMCGWRDSKTRQPFFSYQHVALMKLLSAYKTKSAATINIKNDNSGFSSKVGDFWTMMKVAKGGLATTERTFDFSESKGNGKVVVISGDSHNDAVFAGCTINGVFDIYRVCEHEIDSISAYDNSVCYANGDEVIYQSKIFACKNPIQTEEEFDSEKWVKLLNKRALPNDSVLLLWRNRDCFMDSYEVKGIKKILMKPGTTTEQSFDVFTIADNSLIINKIGAGEDNVLPL